MSERRPLRLRISRRTSLGKGGGGGRAGPREEVEGDGGKNVGGCSQGGGGGGSAESVTTSSSGILFGSGAGAAETLPTATGTSGAGRRQLMAVTTEMNSTTAMSSSHLIEDEDERGSGGVDEGVGVRRKRLPPGLANLGNTCYFNSVVQVLYHVKPFRSALIAWSPPLHEDSERFSLALALKRLFVEMSEVGKRKGSQHISPQDFLAVLREQNGEFSGYGQQDAHEFLRFLLDKVNDAFRATARASAPHLTSTTTTANSSNNLNTSTTTSITDDSPSGAGTDSTTSEPPPKRRKRPNELERIFEGSAVNAIRCFECDTISRKTEPFLDVSLPVQTGWSLSWAFSQHVQKERLIDKYNCGFCMQYTQAERWWQLDAVPPVMTLHLKLFTYGRSTRGKVSAAVRCPRSICFQRWCDNQNASDEYQLDAVIVHEGDSASSGHYYAYVREDGWFCFDDAEVTSIEEADLKRKLFPPVKPKKTAYLLFYRKGSRR